MRYRAHMKARKEKAVRKLFDKEQNQNTTDYSPFKRK